MATSAVSQTSPKEIEAVTGIPVHVESNDQLQAPFVARVQAARVVAPFHLLSNHPSASAIADCLIASQSLYVLRLHSLPPEERNDPSETPPAHAPSLEWPKAFPASALFFSGRAQGEPDELNQAAAIRPYFAKIDSGSVHGLVAVEDALDRSELTAEEHPLVVHALGLALADAWAQGNLGGVLFRLDRRTEGRPHLEAVVGLASDDAQEVLLSGQVRSSLGEKRPSLDPVQGACLIHVGLQEMSPTTNTEFLLAPAYTHVLKQTRSREGYPVDVLGTSTELPSTVVTFNREPQALIYCPHDSKINPPRYDAKATASQGRLDLS